MERAAITADSGIKEPEISRIIYILVANTNGVNDEPVVLQDRNQAVRQLKSLYDNCVAGKDYLDIAYSNLDDTSAVILYSDGIIHRFNVFEVKIPVSNL